MSAEVPDYLFLFALCFLFQRCPRNMEAQNLTPVSQFHLMVLSEDSELQLILFGLFLSMYLVFVLGNLLIILAVTVTHTSAFPCISSSPYCPWSTFALSPSLFQR
jgi:hypothetical protein